jgi:GAF domain-containing protein
MMMEFVRDLERDAEIFHQIDELGDRLDITPAKAFQLAFNLIVQREEEFHKDHKVGGAIAIRESFATKLQKDDEFQPITEDHLRYVACSTDITDEVVGSLAEPDSVTWSVLKANSIYRIADTKDPSIAKDILFNSSRDSNAIISSMVGLPLVLHDETIGVLTFKIEGQKRNFDDEDVKFFSVKSFCLTIGMRISSWKFVSSFGIA